MTKNKFLKVERTPNKNFSMLQNLSEMTEQPTIRFFDKEREPVAFLWSIWPNTAIHCGSLWYKKC